MTTVLFARTASKISKDVATAIKNISNALSTMADMNVPGRLHMVMCKTWIPENWDAHEKVRKQKLKRKAASAVKTLQESSMDTIQGMKSDTGIATAAPETVDPPGTGRNVATPPDTIAAVIAPGQLQLQAGPV